MVADLNKFHNARKCCIIGLARSTLVIWLVLIGRPTEAAPYAAIVLDGHTGEVLHARNADTRLHPATLVKMMTLYVAFRAIQDGEISLDTPVLISPNAASEPPSKLGLRAGQTLELRYLLRAAAIKSANDAATAIAEGISGGEPAFVERMNTTGQRMGLTRTTFRNAHGLTETAQMSSARDMATLARRLYLDFPGYYNLFSRRSTDAGVATVRNTNRRLLSEYNGADGIKTGYTRAAGFNLAASAQRGSKRVFVVVFGGRSSASRNARVAELMDMGFARIPERSNTSRPQVLPQENDSQQPSEAVSNGRPEALRPQVRPKTSMNSSEATIEPLRPEEAPTELPIARLMPTLPSDMPSSGNANDTRPRSDQNVSGVPVIHAIDSPWRVAPKDPGGAKLDVLSAEWSAMFEHQKSPPPANSNASIARVGVFPTLDEALRRGYLVARLSEKSPLPTILGIVELKQASSEGFAIEFSFTTDISRVLFCEEITASGLKCS
ncbi:MAG: D-alanyl-D-alanine carboxypeptidase family protein [Pseudoruegeria sp.]